MASDKGKGVVTGTRRTRSSTAKAPLKQKTLFDSFFTKNAPTENQPHVPVENLSNNSAAPNGDEMITAEPISVDTPEPEAKDPSPPIEIIDDSDNDATQEKLTIDSRGAYPVDRLSSPVVIVEDTMNTSFIPHTPSNKPRQPVSRRRSKEEGRTPDQPIVIASSPIKGPSTSLKPNKPIHPFFGAKLKVSTTSVPPAGKKSITSPAAQIPLYPDQASQHVRGPQTSVSYASSTRFPKRVPKPPQPPLDEPTSYEFLKRCNTEEEEPPKPWIHRISDTLNKTLHYDIPEEHEANYPAIARVMHDKAENTFTSRRPWTEKWRPSCAQEVLGNEKSAIYLRNWLRALELQLEDPTAPPVVDVEKVDNAITKQKQPKRGTKRPRVVRTVEKKRKKSRIDSEEEDDWIVHTDDETEEEDVYYDKMDEFDDILAELPASSQSSAAPDIPTPSIPESQESEKAPDLGQLHNTILLTGPHGSGKTASVYACAEELGWDVFEVYPGVGRRNGASVDNLIGEVGKNHLVLQNRQSGDVLKSFLRQNSKSEARKEDNQSTNDFQSTYSPRKKSNVNPTPEPEDMGNSTGDAKPIRQSLILLEEVDILFKEDTNFWTTVTRIIKECKRPVICTCNDLSLVPVHDLPLQNILHFEPCPSDIAASYLQALCSAEGYSVNRGFVSRLYTDPLQGQGSLSPLSVICATANNFGPPEIQSAVTPTTLEDINGANDQDGEPSAQPIGDASRISMKKSEFLSFLDGSLHLDYSRNFAAVELAGYLPSDDDEIGHVILYDLHVKDTAQFGFYDRHEDILTTAVQLSRGLFDVDVKADAITTQTFEESSRIVRYEQRLVLQEVCPVAIWARRDAALPLDYIPMIRQIVEAEDMQEALEKQKRPRVGRTTRNSARSGYVRMVSVTEEARRIITRTSVEGA
ncbi:hypothetical protein BDZ97DRAFT_35100 [Flammula alnicola]|nr:hypothetical protein BDZ97DRAFT_35100 [Flammula alnicola]